MIFCVPNRLMIFLFQTAFSAAEAAKLFTSHRASVLQQSSARAVIAPSAMVRLCRNCAQLLATRRPRHVILIEYKGGDRRAGRMRPAWKTRNHTEGVLGTLRSAKDSNTEIRGDVVHHYVTVPHTILTGSERPDHSGREPFFHLAVSSTGDTKSKGVSILAATPWQQNRRNRAHQEAMV